MVLDEYEFVVLWKIERQYLVLIKINLSICLVNKSFLYEQNEEIKHTLHEKDQNSKNVYV